MSLPLLLEPAHLAAALRLLEWDQETYMPNGVAENRAEQIGVVAGILGPSLARFTHDQLVPLYLGTYLGMICLHLIVLAISAVTGVDGNPPYASPLDPANLTLDSYRLLASDDLYFVALLNSLRTGEPQAASNNPAKQP